MVPDLERFGEPPSVVMSPAFTRKLLAVHRWCSVVVSVNFIVLALTGLVLVFHDEIDDLLGVVPPAATADSAKTIPIARAVEVARAATPDGVPLYVFQQPDEAPNVIYVGFGVGAERMQATKIAMVDRHTGELLPKVDFEKTFSAIVLQIHAELFLGPFGRVLVGLIGLAILVSLGTGVVVYGPTMRRFAFGMLRRDRSRRTLLADIHKLLGAATFGWNLVVAATGFLLCFSTFLLQLFATTELAAMAKPYGDAPVVTDYSTIDRAIAGAEAAEAHRTWATVALPGSALSTPRHYGVLLKGDHGLEEHMFGLVVVDAVQPETVIPKEFPWYLKAVLVSEPLHFGNYGKLPLKIVWSLFTVVTLGLSVTGVWVFFVGRRKRKAEADALVATAEAAA